MNKTIRGRFYRVITGGRQAAWKRNVTAVNRAVLLPIIGVVTVGFMGVLYASASSVPAEDSNELDAAEQPTAQPLNAGQSDRQTVDAENEASVTVNSSYINGESENSLTINGKTIPAPNNGNMTQSIDTDTTNGTVTINNSSRQTGTTSHNSSSVEINLEVTGGSSVN